MGNTVQNNQMMEARLNRIRHQVPWALSLWSSAAGPNPDRRSLPTRTVLPSICDEKSLLEGLQGVALSRDPKGVVRKVGFVPPAPNPATCSSWDESVWLTATSRIIRHLIDVAGVDTLSLPVSLDLFTREAVGDMPPLAKARLRAMKAASVGATTLSARFDGIESPLLPPEAIVGAAEASMEEGLLELGFRAIGIQSGSGTSPASVNLPFEQVIALGNVALLMNVVAERAGLIWPPDGVIRNIGQSGPVRVYADPSIEEMLLHTELMGIITGSRELMPLRFVLSKAARDAVVGLADAQSVHPPLSENGRG